MKKKAFPLVILGLLYLSLPYFQATFNDIEYTLLDQRIRLRGGLLPASKDIVIVGLDAHSREFFEAHPEYKITGGIPPRRWVGKAINYISQQNPKAILLDVEFRSPQTKEDDGILENAIERSNKVYLSSAADLSLKDWEEQLKRTNLSSICLVNNYEEIYKGKPSWLQVLSQKSPKVNSYLSNEDKISFCRMSEVQQEFLSASKGLGITSIDQEQVGFVRSILPLFKGYQGNYYPFLPLSFYSEDKSISYSKDLLQIGIKKIPLIDGRLMIQWRAPRINNFTFGKTIPELGYGHLYRFISFSDLIQQMEQKQTAYSFKNKIVIYGDVLKDIHRTPVGDIIAGPEIHAAVLDSLIHDKEFIHKIPDWVNNFFLLILVCNMGFVLLKSSSLNKGIIISCGLIGFYWAFNIISFTEEATWLPLAIPTGVFILTLIVGSAYRYYIQEKEKRSLTQTFSKFVSPQVMNQILMNPNNALEQMRGTKKELTVLFSDLQGFTALSENADPQNIAEQLNEYFNEVIKVILKYEGTYDKFIGDSVMVFFGAPINQPDHAKRACLTALEMQEVLEKLNQKWIKENKPTLKQGIGLSTGIMFVGNIGSDEIKSFTVIGEVVNLGARLESATRQLNTPILISQKTYEQANINAYSKGEIQLKGFSQSIPVYALID